MNQKHLSNLKFLKTEFSDIIMADRTLDQTGKSSSRICQRATFVFKDSFYLSITEYIADDGTLNCFFYDWYSPNGTIRLKFHSEPHNDKRYQTKTES